MLLYSCLFSFKKSKSNINLLLKYWWLKKTKMSLAEKIFGHNLRTRFFSVQLRIFENQLALKYSWYSFHRMLKGPLILSFCTISSQNNNLIFLKSLKTLFKGHFWPFLVIFARIGVFPEKIQLFHEHPLWP